jgi:hypothetical protein
MHFRHRKTGPSVPDQATLVGVFESEFPRGGSLVALIPRNWLRAKEGKKQNEAGPNSGEGGLVFIRFASPTPGQRIREGPLGILNTPAVV